MDSRLKKNATQEKIDMEKAAGAMDERMDKEEQELSMLKDCAALLAQAKLESDKEKQQKETEPDIESLLSRNVKVKPTGVLKIMRSSGDQFGKNERSKGSIAADRLLEDKMYLSELAKGITKRTPVSSNDGVDNVYKVIKDTAEEALQFLTDREDFWDQLALGTDKSITKKGRKGKPSKALESTRLIF